MKPQRIDKTLLSQVNSQTLLDSDDQSSLIEHLNLINNSNFNYYLNLINASMVAEIGLVLVLQLFGIGPWVCAAIVLCLGVNFYRFNMKCAPIVSHMNVALVLACVVGSWYNQLFVVPVINYANYFYLFHSFNGNIGSILSLSTRQYKYKDV
ncbi:hypothetical protein PSN45_001410 [Yamadazyma tenuis]|uniref:Uncharacterized protein n=1 Tax=Candida tenuis (strain ATCC 10573 / BCRC 21748 / CBS 615 / JCM 9827 / NBRC 10315 / NRRL Y-1498 / VKM Y-70) TaxID=590646 RepID=G3BCC3_CANTC|nr:uncharacterized protein CANTEDRAFT_116870 [Yamadazyma tenuis ATCC 10573]EGV60801.1 hypothetical protein CANTEDRAFT_116870 [Yamadazyma tenuis ATCC 10573]WEJ93933.1 hypothetical protein PSN45_001410 [Yamadazyma tenuis]